MRLPTPKSTEVEEETGKSPAAAQTHRPFYPLQKTPSFRKLRQLYTGSQLHFLLVCLKNHNLNLEGV